MAHHLDQPVLDQMQDGSDEPGEQVEPQIACKQADRQCIVKTILPGCTDHQLDCALTPLIQRNLWSCVKIVLERGVSASQQHWVIQEAFKHAPDVFIAHIILPLCTDEQLACGMETLIERGIWQSVGKVLQHEINTNSKHPRWSVSEAWKKASTDHLLSHLIPNHVRLKLDTAVQQLAARGLWRAVGHLLHRCVSDTLYHWATGDPGADRDDEGFWEMVKGGCDHVQFWEFERDWITICDFKCASLQIRFHFFPNFTLFCEAVMEIVKETWISAHGQGKEKANSSLAAEQANSVMAELNECLQEFKCELEERGALPTLHCIRKWFKSRATCTNLKHVFCAVHFMKVLMKDLHARSAQEVEAILITLATIPVLAEVQSVLLRVMLRHGKWELMSQASVWELMSQVSVWGVWEQDRRHLLQAAVRGQQWSDVRHWADHTVCHELRVWAMEEAAAKKQWDIVLLLTDHGLTHTERMQAYYRLARHADWKIVIDMLETAGDVSQIKHDLINQLSKEESALETHDLHPRVCQLKEFEDNLRERREAVKTLSCALERGEWCVARSYLHDAPLPDQTSCALRAGLAQQAWRFVLQLVRQEMGTEHRDWLFPEMVRLQQWAVGRALLEQGVSVELCVQQLPDLIKHNQWMLVSMVMQNKEVDDSLRQRVMQQAMQVREGSVVAQCISNMQNPLSAEERRDVYEQALNCKMWQAVKTLIEEDSSEILHFDTVLLLAIDRHQQDVVDLCQRHRADINKPDTGGYSPIQRAALEDKWELVLELKMRGGDPGMLDKGGQSVLHRAINKQYWDTVKLLVQYHGDIHQIDRFSGRTVVQMLIDCHRADILEVALTWHPDQQSVVNSAGETPLHAACLSPWPSTVYNLTQLGVNPFSLTTDNLSAFAYAVFNPTCPHKMVVECIRLGFYPHQPYITETLFELNPKSPFAHPSWGRSDLEKLLLAPMFLSVVRGLPVVTQMLHETLVCPQAELIILRKYLPELLDMSRVLIGPDCDQVNTTADYLMKASAVPRSLKSTCRMAVLRCFHANYPDNQQCLSDAVNRLNLPESLKNYILFLDLKSQCSGNCEEQKISEGIGSEVSLYTYSMLLSGRRSLPLSHYPSCSLPPCWRY